MKTGAWGPALLRAEWWIAWVLVAFGLAAFPLARGQAGIIWDTLNHHIYLGWIAEHPRFDRDFLAANWQSYQFPYLYWPAYKLAVAGVSGTVAGVVFALMQSLAAPPLWIVARRIIPGTHLEDAVWRLFAVAFAFMGGVTLSLLDTTSNDVLAAIPLLWAIALAFVARGKHEERSSRIAQLVGLSGLFAGVSVACKLSNGPLALVMPVLWLVGPPVSATAGRRVMIGSAATVIGFLAAYGWWGWEMWVQFGNPIYPFADPSFDPLREWLHWAPPR